jgi:hypothetical protein
MKRCGVVLGLGVLALGTLSGCGGGDADPVLAEVGSRSITSSDFVSAYARMKAEERPEINGLEDKTKFLEDLITKEVMELAAFEAYPELTDKQKNRIKRYQETAFTNLARDHLVRNQVIITDEMKDKIYANKSRERNLEAMLILDPDAAAYVYKELEAGADFKALARDHSVKWVSHVIQGDLGWVEAGTKFPYPVELEVWDAPVGSLVGPIELPQGSFIVRILDERPAEVPATREELEGLIEQEILEPLYLSRLKEVQDSLRAAVDPYISAEARALLTMKYYWEVPEDQVDNEMARLDAQRVTPTFTAEEATMIVVDFKDTEDWTAVEFAERLSWYPGGLWPDGQSEEDLMKCINMMLREFLFIKAGYDLGYEEEVTRRMDVQSREMRVTYFYYNNIMPRFSPVQAEIDSFFQVHRDVYSAPKSYKVGFFAAKDAKELIADLVADWKKDVPFGELRAKYEARDPELVAIGESEWLYEGQDVVRDDIIATLKDGGICEPLTRSDITMSYKLIAKRPARRLTYGEVKEQVDEDAKTIITDSRLQGYLSERREEFGVKIHEKALEKLDLTEIAAETEVGPKSG